MNRNGYPMWFGYIKWLPTNNTFHLPQIPNYVVLVAVGLAQIIYFQNISLIIFRYKVSFSSL